MNFLQSLLDHACISKQFLEVKTKKEKPHQISILQLDTTQSDILAPTPTPDTHSPRTAIKLVLFQHPQHIYISRTFILALKTTYLIITYGEN